MRRSEDPVDDNPYGRTGVPVDEGSRPGRRRHEGCRPCSCAKGALFDWFRRRLEMAASRKGRRESSGVSSRPGTRLRLNTAESR